jgi:hypothetical protein
MGNLGSLGIDNLKKAGKISPIRNGLTSISFCIIGNFNLENVTFQLKKGKNRINIWRSEGWHGVDT